MDSPPTFQRAGDLRAANRVLTAEECAALDAAAAKARAERQTAAACDLAAGVSPFRVHREKILGCHSTAQRLQAVVLNLYNDGWWAKKAPVYLSSLIANADAEHVEVLIDLIRAYKRNGENDRDFLALGRELAVARQPKSRRERAAA